MLMTTVAGPIRPLLIAAAATALLGLTWTAVTAARTMPGHHLPGQTVETG